jgi:hypothetical protein
MSICCIRYIILLNVIVTIFCSSYKESKCLVRTAQLESDGAKSPQHFFLSHHKYISHCCFPALTEVFSGSQLPATESLKSDPSM